jgi:hypothetical protein
MASRGSSAKPTLAKRKSDHSTAEPPSAKRSRKKDALSVFNESVAKDSEDLRLVQKSQIEMQRERLAHTERLQEMKIKAEERQRELDRQERASQMQAQNQLMLNLLSRFIPPNPSHHSTPTSPFTFTPQGESSFPNPNGAFDLFSFPPDSQPGGSSNGGTL